MAAQEFKFAFFYFYVYLITDDIIHDIIPFLERCHQIIKSFNPSYVLALYFTSTDTCHPFLDLKQKQ